MPSLTISGAANFNMVLGVSGTSVSFTSIPLSTINQFVSETAGSPTITNHMFGSFSYPGGNLAGTVSSLNFSIGTFTAAFTGLPNVNAAQLIGGTSHSAVTAYWHALMGVTDDITINGDTSSNHVLSADYINFSSDAHQGQDDSVRISGASSILRLSGDHHLPSGTLTGSNTVTPHAGDFFGGNDSITITNSGEATNALEITGDVNVIDYAIVYRGGADVIISSGVGAPNTNKITGDAGDVTGQGVMYGGNDTLSVSNFNSQNYELIGDVARVGVATTGLPGFAAGTVYGGGDSILIDANTDYAVGDVFELHQGYVLGGNDTITKYLATGTPVIVGDLYTIKSSTNASSVFIGGNDTVYGAAGADFVYGDLFEIEAGAAIGVITFGSDTLIGGDGDDHLHGDMYLIDELPGGTSVTFGNDTIYGGEGNDRIYGDFFHGTLSNRNGPHGGNDIIFGDAGNDFIWGNGGNDRIEGGSGDDVLYGGDGVDTIVYENAISGVTINLSTSGQRDTGGSGLDTIEEFENIIGSSHKDYLTGTSGNNVITANAGDDFIYATSGNDTVYGGAGSDRVDYAAATSGITVTQASGGAAGSVTGWGTDAVYDVERFIGTNHADTFNARSSTPTVYAGESGDDTFIAAMSNDTYEGNKGFDTVNYSSFSSAVTVNVPQKSATASGVKQTISEVEQYILSNHNDIFIGYESAVVVFGGGGTDTITGGDGDDFISGGFAIDYLDGGNGTDVVDYTYSSAHYTVDLVLGTAYITTAGSGGETLANFENVNMGGGNDIIIGDSSVNVLSGGGGNDRFVGGGGADVFHGGTGTDEADFSAETQGRFIDLANNYSWVSANGSVVTTFSSIENVTGTAGSDTIYGDGNNNILAGGAGHDYLLSGGGNDALIGGDGDDVYSVSSMGTSVTEHGGQGNDTVYLQFATFNGDVYDVSDHVETVVYLSTGGQYFGNGTLNINDSDNLIITATNILGTVFINAGGGHDTIFIGRSAEVNAGAGNDIIVSSLTSNRLTGGDGNDTYILGDVSEDPLSNPIITEGSGLNSGYDTVYSYASIITMAANIEVLVMMNTLDDGSINRGLGNELNNTIIGNGVADSIYGADGNDFLIGGGGNDVLIGGDGLDTMQGNIGSDTFRYFERSEFGDIIQDWISGEDNFEFDNYHIDGVSAGDTLVLGQNFISSDAPTSVLQSGTFLWDTDDTALYYDHDGTGAMDAVLVADIQAFTTVTVDDFIFS